MNTISLNQWQIADLRAAGVQTLYLFGSRAQGVASRRSDFDFAVLLDESTRARAGYNLLPVYQKLYRILTDLIPVDAVNSVIDIVFLQSGVSLELQGHVVRHGQLLLDDNPRARADYEQQVMIRVADFVPVLKIMDDAILQRI